MRKYVLQLGSEVFQPGGVEESHFREPKNLEVGSYICPKCEEGYELGMKLKKHTQEGTSKLAPALRKIGFGLPKL